MALISSNLNETAAALSRIPGDVEFAGVVALTRTGKRIQLVIQAQADAKFNLKNKFTIRSVRLSPATKQNIEARIFTTYEALTVQDEGGTRRRGISYIPGRGFERATGIDPKKKVIRKRFKGPNIGEVSFKAGKKRARPFTLKSGGKEFIAVRQAGASNPLDILYLTVRGSVRIPKREFFEEPGEKEYNEAFEIEYDRAFEQFVKLR